jgi:LAS superfamily LD-carboxypeptidase LdcB
LDYKEKEELKNLLGKDLYRSLLLPIGGLVLVSALGFGLYTFLHLKQENLALNSKLLEVQTNLAELNGENIALNGKVADAEQIVNEYAGKLGEIASRVGNLQKLSETDKELLEKYSKVYFLNENFVPNMLSNIASSTLFNKNKVLQIHTGVKFYLEKMISDGNHSDLNLLVLSAYRSFGMQGGLKTAYKFTYGSGANQFSADQGYSEHQLGTAVDFTNPKIGEALSGFSKTVEYKWLLENAHKYGFILSYPEGNNYYVYEPWHWRFVGVELATKLHQDRKYFYDLDQREIDTYLLKIFN